MSSVLHSLYGRLAAIFLLLLLVFGLVQLWVWMQSARSFYQEADQSYNLGLAQDLAQAFAPHLEEGIDQPGIDALLHRVMVFNPRAEVYVLGGEGRVRFHFSGDNPVEQPRVDTAPILTLLEQGKGAPLPVLGDDPRDPDQRKPFSVARVNVGGEPGFLYVILGGEKFQSLADMVEQSYIIRNGALSLAATVLLFGVAGLVSFFLLTKRLRTVTASVRAFQAGDYARRVNDRRRDEIGQLGGAFNEMADTVAAHVEQMARDDRMRRELVANVSHDLRSPLSLIQGYLETLLMKEAELSEAERKRFLEIIHGNATRLSTLVAQLFELSQLDAHEVRPAMEPFALPELAQDIVLKFRPRADEQHLVLRCEVSGEPPPVYGDIGMIERALTNLLDNALRYTPAGGEVTVRLHANNGVVQVAVQDTGRGIAPEDLPHVFERFHRGDRARRRDGGAGLGLAIVKRLVEAHGSTVSVDSRPGEGSAFRFALRTEAPADDEPASGA